MTENSLTENFSILFLSQNNLKEKNFKKYFFETKRNRENSHHFFILTFFL